MSSYFKYCHSPSSRNPASLYSSATEMVSLNLQHIRGMEMITFFSPHPPRPLMNAGRASVGCADKPDRFRGKIFAPQKVFNSETLTGAGEAAVSVVVVTEDGVVTLRRAPSRGSPDDRLKCKENNCSVKFSWY